MGLVIGIRYLMGWALATHPANREQPEWPPHPDRIYMALAAAYFESDHEVDETRALEWLERQEPPTLIVSRGFGRKVITSYVPVNDTQMSRWKSGAIPSNDQISSGLSLLPSNRSKQARQFPTVLLEDDLVYLKWGNPPDGEVFVALQRLCRKVTRVGHSASLVQMWVSEELPDSSNRRTLTPTDKIGPYRLRTARKGRLKSLANAFAAGRRPPTSTYQAYEEAIPQELASRFPTSEFSEELLVLTALPQPKRFGLQSTLLISQHLRRLILSRCPDPIPEWISGHLPDGAKSEQAHLAIVPLPHVGREFADGHLLGLGLVVPRQRQQEIARHLGPMLLESGTESSIWRLTLGKAGEWKLALEQRDEVPQALQPETWTAARIGARLWATVTPFVLDRHWKKRNFQEAAELAIRAACLRIGLPDPDSVEVTKVSPFIGTPSVYEFPPLLRKDGSTRLQTHCVLRFNEPVTGPILLGAGRYRGYGFCRPLNEEKGSFL